jgi:hypothetical protein
MIVLLLSLLAPWGMGDIPDFPSTPFHSPDYNFEVLDHWPYGSGTSVLIDDDILYYTNGAVLEIGEVSSAGQITWLSELRFSGWTYTMDQWGDRLYVAVDDQGIAIVDVSSLDSPQLLNLFPTAGRVFGLEVRSDTVYAAMGSEGLEIYDCRISTNPQLLGTLSGFNFRSLRLQDSLLFATEVAEGLLVFDVSDPTMPFSVGELSLTGQHYGLALDRSREVAVVCSFDGGLHLVDVSVPNDPVLDTTIQIFLAWAVDLGDSLAYVATWNDSVHVIDLASHEEVGSFGFGEVDVVPYDISLGNDYGALAGYLGSWWVFDIADPSSPLITDYDVRGGYCEVVATSQDWIVIGRHGGKLEFFPTGDSLIPTRWTSTADWPRDLEIHNDTLYVAEGWEGLVFYDISGADEVNLISRLAFDSAHVWALEVDSGFAYLACGKSGLIVVDLSDPVNPSEVARLAFGVRALSILKDGDTVFVGLEGSGIQLVDVSDPEIPGLLNLNPTAGTVLDMLVRDSLLYTAQAPEGAVIYVLSDWRVLSSLPSEHFTFSLDLSNDVLFIADGAAGIFAYDVSNPGHPHRLGSLNTCGEARDIVSVGDTLLIADGYDGFMKVLFLNLGVKESAPSLICAIEIWPNPVVSTLHFSRSVDAALYDALGRLKAQAHGDCLDVSCLRQGVYFLKGVGWSQKIVKLHN